jgi:hypothetical protein
VTSSLIGTNISLSTLFSNTYQSVCLPKYQRSSFSPRESHT